MELQELFRILREGIQDGTLRLNGFIANMAFLRFVMVFPRWELAIDRAEAAFLSGSIRIQGVCRIGGWNQGEPLEADILCTKPGETLVVMASFRSRYEGTLGGFFGNVYPCLKRNADGQNTGSGIIREFPIIRPELTLSTADLDSELPFELHGGTHAPKPDGWEPYGFMVGGIKSISGRVDCNGRFRLEALLPVNISGTFASLSMSLLLFNGIEYGESFRYPVISEAGAEICMNLGSIPEVRFSVPLFQDTRRWNLSAQFREGLGVGDILRFFMSFLPKEGSLASLCLPSGVALDKFRLYRADILTQRDRLHLTPFYLSMEFALSEPWNLPIPYVTLERLDAVFQASLGKGKASGLFTAAAGGTVSIDIGKYKLSLGMDMTFPELDFSASASLTEQKNGAVPSLWDMAETFRAPLPSGWGRGGNLLAEVTVSGSAVRRELAVKAEVRDVLELSAGNLRVCLSSLRARAQVSTSRFTFSVQGVMDFGSGKDGFALYAAAAYHNPGWLLEGGLLEGRVSLGKVFTQMFRGETLPSDVSGLELTELTLSYSTFDKEFRMTAAFEAGWHVVLLGEELVLGGRVQVLAADEKPTDVSALAFLKLGDFQILAQVDHIQSAEDRSYLFRLKVRDAYIQAAYLRGTEESLTVSLGGMTLGSLAESLAYMINPNQKYVLPAPWNILNKISLDRFLFEFNVTKRTASFLYRVQLEIAGLMYLDEVGLGYDMVQRKLFFVLTGRLLDQEYGRENPVKWDALNGRPPVGQAEDEKRFELAYLGLGQHVGIDGLSEAEGIDEAVRILKEQLSPPSGGGLPGEIRYDSGSQWLFGIDFTVNETVNVRLVMNQPKLYGIRAAVQAKEGSPLAAFDGFGIELLYRKISETTGMFRGEVLVPKKYRSFQLGIFSLTLGVISVEIYTDGGFYIDLGFPHQQDFSRSFQFQWSIYNGKGGVYLGVLKDVAKPTVPKITNGSFSPILMLGVGLSVGMGRSFDFGIVSGGVSLEVFGILEGAFACFREKDTGKEDTYYYVKAAAGISGRLFLSVDLKIIAVQASVEVNASAAVTVTAYRQTRIELELSLELRASIKILFIKIRFSFSFHQKVQFAIGKDTKTPWIEEGSSASERRSNLGPARRRNLRLGSVRLEKRRIEMELTPMFVWENPSREPVKKRYALALLMVMGNEDFRKWNRLLVDWILSHVPGERVEREDAEQIAGGFADGISWEILRDFLEENLLVDYRIRWLSADSANEQQDGYVFPMLPSLKVRVTEGETEHQVRYWEDHMVDAGYFDLVTEYFSEMNADPSYRPESAKGRMDGEDGIPAAKAFLTDYVQMYLRELAGQIGQLFREYSGQMDFGEACREFGVDGREILRQNPGLVLAKDRSIVFSTLKYTVTAQDTLELIGRKYWMEEEALWETVKDVVSLPQTGSRMAFGRACFGNGELRLTLKETAAVLFVRFYEEYASKDEFYAGDIVRMNTGIGMDWQEETPYGRTLHLPGRERMWQTLRGDTPQRIAGFLGLTEIRLGEHPLWDGFCKEVCRMNGGDENSVLEKVWFEVPEVLVYRERTLSELAARICPENADMGETVRLIGKAEILRVNTPLTLTGAKYVTAKSGQATAAEVMGAAGCTAEELAQALLEDETLVPKQDMVLRDVKAVRKMDILKKLEERADETGAILSRFLLQGLKVPAPDGGEALPLYRVLGQQIALEDVRRDIRLAAASEEEGCGWVDAGERAVVMREEEIEPWLPDGGTDGLSGSDFTGFPEKWEELAAFQETNQVFSSAGSMAYHRSDGWRGLYRLSDAVANVLHGGGKEPLVTDEAGEVRRPEWGCLVPIRIGVSDAEDLFCVYGADAVKRRVLYGMLERGGWRIRFLYQTSEISRGGRCFMEYEWSKEVCFLVKTNFSVETRMEAAGKQRAEEEMENIARLTRPGKVLQMLWECSTVGGGGYYLCLRTGDGKTLPADIFDEDGFGTLWLLGTVEHFFDGLGYMNCFSVEDGLHGAKTVGITTQDESQRVKKPCFPAGCVGLSAFGTAPAEEDSSTNASLKRLFQITGYQVRAQEGSYKESRLSAPVIPAEKGEVRSYEAVIPLYRYAVKDREDVQDVCGQGACDSELCVQAAKDGNPYGAVGKPAIISMELRDVLGNSVVMKETEMFPCYNDCVIGLGEWVGTQSYYRIRKNGGGVRLELYLEYADSGKITPEMVERQRRAFWQIGCQDVEVRIISPINGQQWELSKQMGEDASALDLVRGYGEMLSDWLEGKRREPPLSLKLELDLDLVQFPLPKEPFEVRMSVVTERKEFLAPEKEAQRAESEILPYGSPKDAWTFQKFCEDAREACPTLFFAWDGSGNSVLYGVTAGQDGFLKRCEILPGMLEHTAAPEFYGFRPLHNGFLNRSVKVRQALDDCRLGDEYQMAEATEVDLEVWAFQYLYDFEQLLLPGQARKAGRVCPGTLDRILEVKKRLANAIARQMSPLRRGGKDVPKELYTRARDRLSRSLYEGYGMDIAASYQLVMETKKPCRLAADVVNRTGDCQITAGKAQTGKENFFLFFTNHFQENVRDLQADIVFTELEYDIKMYQGYVSSRWLRFVMPLSPDVLNIGRTSLESGLYLPNPLKSCPTAPTFGGHGCTVRFKDAICMEGAGKRLCWDYAMDFTYRYEAQDRIFIRIEFEALENRKNRGIKRDLADLLAEYMGGREKLWQGLQGDEDVRYENACVSFLDIGEQMVDAWMEWIGGEAPGKWAADGKQDARACEGDAGMAVYSCMVSGAKGESGIEFSVESTEEGQRFLDFMGVEQVRIEPVGDKNEFGQAVALRFYMEGLPLYQCSAACPEIYVVRNQNLLYDKRRRQYLDVGEEFIYRTPRVMGQMLNASGYDGKEWFIGETRTGRFCEDTIYDAVDILFDALGIRGIGLGIELGVSYYFELNQSAAGTRVILPVTFLPLDDEGDAKEARLAENMLEWYREHMPDTTGCGFLFHIKVYGKGSQEWILYFPKLNVRCR